MSIYLDHNAGAPLRPEARDAIAQFDEFAHGNSASVHRSGQRARSALERAREQVAALIGAPARQIVFTSGGTESNNLAIYGAAKTLAGRRKIVTSAIEHSSILAPLSDLEGRVYEVVRIAPDSDGRVEPRQVIDAIDRDVALATLGLANAEVGTIQNLAPLAEPIAKAGALFHIDAAQALGRMAVDITALGCDLMTLSGQKIGAPSGIGALYVREGVSFASTILGGPQERGLRAGTPNLLGAIAFGAAAEAVAEGMDGEILRIGALADRLLAQLRASIPGLSLNGPVVGRIPNTLNFTFPGVLGESMLIALDLEGVEVSMGSACAAGAVEPSHVLLAMGRSAAQARSSLRISLGWNNTEAQIDAAAKIILRVWKRVRESEPAPGEAVS
jgi:cysteine desulfurase